MSDNTTLENKIENVNKEKVLSNTSKDRREKEIIPKFNKCL